MRVARHVYGLAEDWAVAPASVDENASGGHDHSLALRHHACRRSPRRSVEYTGAVFRKELRCQEHQSGSNRLMLISHFVVICLPSSNSLLPREACYIMTRIS